MIEIYSKILGVDLTDGRRTRDLAWARFCAYADMSDNGLTVREIASLFGGSQAGVSAGIRAFNDALSVDDELAWKYFRKMGEGLKPHESHTDYQI